MNICAKFYVSRLAWLRSVSSMCHNSSFRSLRHPCAELGGLSCAYSQKCFAYSGRIAFAYYDPLKGILHVLEDTQETGHFDLTRMCEFEVNSPSRLPCGSSSSPVLEQVSPDYALTSSKSDDEFIDTMRDHSTCAYPHSTA